MTKNDNYYKFLDDFYNKNTKNIKEWNNEKTNQEIIKLLTLVQCKTGGFRSKMKEGLNVINEITVNILATGLSKLNKSFVIGFDHRTKSDIFAEIMAKIFISKEKSVKIFKNCITPYLALESKEYDCGIMITASHNTAEYNGIKLYTSGHQTLNRSIDNLNSLINDSFNSGFKSNDCSEFYTDINNINVNIENYYLPINYEKYFSNFSIKNLTINSYLFKYCFCGVQGYATNFINEACKYFDLKIDTYSSYNIIDSNFSKITHPNPEVENNWNLLFEEKGDKNDVFFMCDGDGDRFGMAIKENNELVRLNPNVIARIFLWYFLKNYDHKSLIFVKTYLTDDFMKKVAKKLNISLKETKTGSKYLAEGILELENGNKKIALAYEDAMGYILNTLREKDGIYPCILMSNILKEKTIKEILNDLEKEYGIFYSYTYHYRCDDPEAMLNKIILNYKNLKYNCDFKYEEIYDSKCFINNEIKIYLRVSGTESLIKIYTFSELINEKELKTFTHKWIEKYFI